MESVAKQNGISFAELIYQLYGGNVSTQSYLSAIQMEYIYNKYYMEKYNGIFESISYEEAKEYCDSLEGDKDTALTRNLAYVSVDDGEAKAKALLHSATERRVDLAVETIKTPLQRISSEKP